jgi:[citrate (pro-3S)-lyase] ligase
MNLYKKVINKFHLFEEIIRIRKILYEIQHFLSVKGVNVLYVDLPNEKKIAGLTSFELDRISNWCFDFNKYKEELPKLKKLYGEDVSQEYILSIFDGGIVVDGKKRKVLLDFSSEHQHIVNGRRITIGQPNKFQNTIFTHGACTWRGTGVEDKETIASFLQENINKCYPNEYRVVNSAIGRGSTIFDDFEVIKEQSYKPGDIVILGSHGLAFKYINKNFFKKIGIEYLETSSYFNRPHNYGEWFNDSTLHTNRRGNKVLANKIYDYICALNWLGNKDLLSHCTQRLSIPMENDSLINGEKIYGDNPNELQSFYAWPSIFD